MLQWEFDHIRAQLQDDYWAQEPFPVTQGRARTHYVAALLIWEPSYFQIAYSGDLIYGPSHSRNTRRWSFDIETRGPGD